MIPYYEISEDAGRDPGFFLFRLDNLAGKFMVRESYCVRPGCDCRQVVLQFGEYDDDPAKNRHLVTMPLSLDSWEWVMGKEYRTQPGSQEASLLECFRTELTGEIKESFLKHYKNAKEYGLSHPLSYLDPGLLEEGVSVGYCEVFEEENSDLFTVSIDGQVYLFDDQYCIDPECDCQETVISVIKIAGAKAEHCGTVIVTHEGCCQVLDGRDNLGIVRQWLKEKDPVELLEQRYKKMKEIGRNLKREVAAQKAVERSKANPGRNKAVVGRNDPCPCGSGKKYKKCCG